MLKRILVAAAGTLAVAVLATAATGPEATAAASKCLNKANENVACTDKLKAKTKAQPLSKPWHSSNFRFEMPASPNRDPQRLRSR